MSIDSVLTALTDDETEIIEEVAERVGAAFRATIVSVCEDLKVGDNDRVSFSDVMLLVQWIFLIEPTCLYTRYVHERDGGESRLACVTTATGVIASAALSIAADVAWGEEPHPDLDIDLSVVESDGEKPMVSLATPSGTLIN